jgi:mannose-6-phosphate isomerase-like protein (cupin superfamily)
MAEPVRETIQGEGWAVGHIEAMGDGWGFRKIRKELDVKAFGINAVVMPPGYAAGRHFHDRQEETYFVHRGTIAIEFGDGTEHVLDEGGLARVDPSTVRRVRNLTDEDAIYVCAGGADGYVGRDGQVPEGDNPRPPAPGRE